jgi:hypothetical protein
MVWWLIGSAVVVIVGLVFVIRFEAAQWPPNTSRHRPAARH